jgi:hypothetical protein
MEGITDSPTLSGVIARLQQSPVLTPTRRRDLISAVLRISEMTGVDPRSPPASMRLMRPLINAVRPAQYNWPPRPGAIIARIFAPLWCSRTPGRESKLILNGASSALRCRQRR